MTLAVMKNDDLPSFVGAIEFTTILRNLLERVGETNEIPREYEPLPTYQEQSSSTATTTTNRDPPPPIDELPPHYSA